jgi:hypothetical protein
VASLIGNCRNIGRGSHRKGEQRNIGAQGRSRLQAPHSSGAAGNYCIGRRAAMRPVETQEPPAHGAGRSERRTYSGSSRSHRRAAEHRCPRQLEASDTPTQAAAGDIGEQRNPDAQGSSRLNASGEPTAGLTHREGTAGAQASPATESRAQRGPSQQDKCVLSAASTAAGK